jgi:hypothetical protein
MQIWDVMGIRNWVMLSGETLRWSFASVQADATLLCPEDFSLMIGKQVLGTLLVRYQPDAGWRGEP